MFSITIGFQGASVTVHTDTDDVIEHLRHRFRKMLCTNDAGILCHITALRCGLDFELDHNGQPLPYTEMLGLLECRVIDALIKANSHFLWLHAGAVARAGKALLIVGDSGCGKSTTTIGLCKRGWSYLSDDTIPLDMDANSTYAFLRTPWFRRMHHQELPTERIVELKTREVEIDDGLIWQGPAEIAMIIFPVYRHGGSLVCERLTGALMAMSLVGQTRNFETHGVTALHFISRLARQLPAWRIEYSDRRLLLNMVVDLWHQSLNGATPCSGEGR